MIFHVCSWFTLWVVSESFHFPIRSKYPRVPFRPSRGPLTSSTSDVVSKGTVKSDEHENGSSLEGFNTGDDGEVMQQTLDFLESTSYGSESSDGDVLQEEIEGLYKEDAKQRIVASLPNNTVADTVNTILVASEEAVAEAEASFSEDVAARLETFPDKTEDPVQEKVPADVAIAVPAVVEKIQAPSIARIIEFAIPATGVWLCSPLLSLIDTSCVGLLSGTIQQAALNPAVSLTEYSALLISFLYTGTTNLIASAREKDRGVEGSPQTTRKLIGSLRLSTYVGIGMGLTLFVFAGNLVRIILGKGSFDPAVFEAAVRYIRIRALGFPAAAMIGTAQAGCLGMQDAKSPLYVLIAAAVVNLIADMAFVGNANPLIGGAAGAAWATIFSQYTAAVFFIQWLCRKSTVIEEKAKTLNISSAILDMMRKPTTTSSEGNCDSGGNTHTSKRNGNGIMSSALKLSRRMSHHLGTGKVAVENPKQEERFSCRGFLKGRVRKRELLRLPSRDIVKEFSPFVLPVTSTQVGRVSCYAVMSHVVSSSLGTLAMAAQQVIVSFFFSICPLADSVGLTAQSFIPSIAEKSPSKDRAVALRKTMVNLSKVGVLFGVLMVGVMSSLPFMSRFSTSDAQVIAMIANTIPYLGAASLLHPFVTGFEGILLGQKDLGFVGKMYTSWLFIVPYFMLRVKKAAQVGHNVGLPSVWKVFLFYQLARCVTWTGRVIFIQRKTDEEVRLMSKPTKPTINYQ